MTCCPSKSCCPTPKKSKFFKWLLLSLGIFLALSLAAILALPAFLSTSWARESILKPLISSYTNGTVNVQTIDLSWFGGQKIEKISINDPQQNFTISIDSLQTATPLWKCLYCPSSMGATQVSNLNASFTAPDGQPIQVTNFQAELKQAPNSHLLFLQANGDVIQGSQKGKILIETSSKFTQEELMHGKANLDFAHLDFKVNIKDLPVEILDRIVGSFKPELRGVLVQSLGKQIDVHVEELPQTSLPTFLLTAHSPNMDLKLIGQVSQGMFTLTQTGTVDLTATQASSKALAAQTNLVIPPGTKLHADVTKLQFPIAKGKDPFSAEFIIPSIPSDLVEQMLHTGGIITEVFGPSLRLKTILLSEKDGLYATIGLSSDLFTIPIVKLKIDDYLSLIEPLTINVPLSPKLEKKFQTFQSKIKELSDLHIQIDSFQLPLCAECLSNLQSRGAVKLGHLLLQDKAPIAALDHLNADWYVSSADNTITFDMTADTLLAESKETGTISVKGQVSNWVKDGRLDLSQLLVTTKAQAQQIPTALVGSFANLPDLEALVGPMLGMTADFNIQYPQTDKNGVELVLKGKHVVIDAKLQVGELIRLKSAQQPITIEWTLTPQGFAFLRNQIKPYLGTNPDQLALDNTTKITMKVSDLSFPTQWNKIEKRTNIAAKAELFINQASFTNKTTKQTYKFDDIAGNIQTKDVNKALSFYLESHGGKGADGSPFTFSASGIVENAFDRSTTIPSSVIADIKLDQFPVKFACDIACLTNDSFDQIDALVGDIVASNINIHFKDFNGTLHANLAGQNGKFDVDAQLTNGGLTLTRPLQASVQVTPKFTKSILKQFMPLLGSAVGGDNPISITVQSDGFYLPLKNWEISKASIKSATLDLGRLYFDNRGQLAELLSILDYKPQGSQPLSIWFTPMYVGLRNGHVIVDRVDFLIAERLPMALWGTVDLNEDKVHLNVGLSNVILANSFGVKGLPADYYLALPIKGTTSNAGVDKKKATAKITSLVVQSQGPQGVVLGTVIDIISNKKDEQIPPPTTDPLPWGTLQADASQDSYTNPVKIPVKMIEQGANQLINLIR